MKIIKLIYGSTFILSVLLFIGCKKFVEVDGPQTSTNSDIVYALDATATAVLTDIYIRLSGGLMSSENLSGLSLYAGLSADELTLFNGVTDLKFVAYYQNNLSASTAVSWNNIYNIIYITNLALEGLNSSKTLTPAVKQQLIGEAKFMRAFCYFYLVNLYGDIPLNLTSDYKVNSVQPRTERSKVFEQIIVDLKDAQLALNDNYLNATMTITQDRTRPNKSVATALLARTYLYINDYSGAEEQATRIISNKSVYDTEELNRVFLKESKEVIWSIQSVNSFITNTVEARLFILPVEGPNASILGGFPVYLNGELKNTFEENDRRAIIWVDSVKVGAKTYNYPSKYKNNIPSSDVTEQSVVLRLAEQYLIRAEARAWQGKLVGPNSAESDLDIIRRRAGLGPTNAITQTEVLNLIYHERQVELFTECGHRWLDLKRTGKADIVLQPIKGSSWQTTDQLYPIPQSEIDRNPTIRGNQNPGY